jgi:hypothetical protein
VVLCVRRKEKKRLIKLIGGKVLIRINIPFW